MYVIIVLYLYSQNRLLLICAKCRFLMSDDKLKQSVFDVVYVNLTVNPKMVCIAVKHMLLPLCCYMINHIWISLLPYGLWFEIIAKNITSICHLKFHWLYMVYDINNIKEYNIKYSQNICYYRYAVILSKQINFIHWYIYKIQFSIENLSQMPYI